MACPLRCATPSRVIANQIMRAEVSSAQMPAGSLPRTPTRADRLPVPRLLQVRARAHAAALAGALAPVPESSAASEAGGGSGSWGAPEASYLLAPDGTEAGAGPSGPVPPMPLWLQLRLAEGLETNALVSRGGG